MLNVINLRKLALTLVIAIGCHMMSWGADTLSFPSSVTTTKTLVPAIYRIDGHHIIETGATLNVQPGVILLFEYDAVIEVRGGLNVNGEPRNFVQIYSEDTAKNGRGFVIVGGDNSKITFTYTRFSSLHKPIQFNKNWSRTAVKFQNNEFVDLSGSGVFFEIRELDKILTNQTVKITIDHNTFGNNSGSLMLAECSGELIQLELTNNVFSRNEFIGRELNGIFTTPIFMNYNSLPGRGSKPLIRNNSICYNFGSLVMSDTVEFFPVYLTAVGSSDFLDVNENYFGDNAKADFDAYQEDMSTSRRAPLLLYDKLQQKPSSDVNGHVYKVGVNGARVDDLNSNIEINATTDQFELVANRPLRVGKKFRINYVHLEDDTLRYEQLEHKIDFSNGNQLIGIQIKDRLLKMGKNGYIKIQGLEDENGFIAPAVNIGLKSFLMKNNVFISGYDDFRRIPKLIQSTPRVYYTGDNPIPSGSASDTGDIFIDSELIDPEDSMLRKDYWDAGILVGTTMYFGDLAYTNITLSLPNARPNLGFRFGYNLTDRYRIELSQNSMVIAGADDRSSIIGSQRGTNFDRGLSFRTWIYDIGVSGEYRLYRFRKIKNIIPSFFAGVSVYYFQPQAEVDGVYYNLRNVGTEGQRQDGSIYAYNRFSVAIPMGIKLSRHLNRNTLVSVSYTYNKLFTDYLDDVSTGPFQSYDQITSVNKDLGPVAYELANPNDMKPGLNRSASGDYDGYSFFGVTFTRKFSF